MRRFARVILLILGTLYYRIRGVRPVWRFLNRQGRTLYARHALSLSPLEATLVASLRERGIAVAHASELFGSLALLEELRRYALSRWENPHIRAAVREREQILATGSKPRIRKPFLINLWDGPAVIDLAHPFIRFSLSDPILRVVNAYLGMFSKFRFWHLEATLPLPPRLRATASQRWHRDPEDRKLVKVFVYLNDVTEAAGPFTYLQYSHDGGKWRALYPQSPPRGTLAMPPHAEYSLPEEDVMSSTGRAGTIIFCDTSGLHRGGLALERPRIMYTSVYTSPASVWPIRYTYPSGFHAGGLSLQARFAVANDPRQRAPRYY